MNINNEQFFEDLAKDYPELMERAKVEYFEIDSGWHRIVRVMCNTMYADVAAANHRLMAATILPRDVTGAHLRECEADYQKSVDALPVIKRIREFFGYMKTEVDGDNEIHRSIINFARGMSSCTCEVCGKPGTSVSDADRIRTACADHRLDDVVDEMTDGATMAHIFDE